jgi:sarcosine oxidase subunit delta
VQLDCPFCGARALEEFEFRKTVPSFGDGFARTYLRVDDPERSVEHWQHVSGCRAWLLVRRNPVNGAVLEVQLLGETPP